MDSSKLGIFYKYATDSNAKAQDSQVIKGEKWRITVITDSLLRLEWSDDGEFVDNPTQTVICRNFAQNSADAQPQFSAHKNANGWLEVETEKLHLTYNCEAFSKEGLSIVVSGVPCTQFNTWHYGDDCPGNLLGTFRTLDQANGPVKLGKGILSRDGWSILDDSVTCEIAPDEEINGKPNPYGA
ncbi:alpha-glucosidase, partial [Bifidobacteriaceae bacterium NR015]